jgi:hypothetical protein
MQGCRPLLVALAGDVEDAVLGVGAEIPHPELNQLADAAGGIRQHGEHSLVADADRDQLLGGVFNWRRTRKRGQGKGDKEKGT